jgi:hypothetical protein
MTPEEEESVPLLQISVRDPDKSWYLLATPSEQLLPLPFIELVHVPLVAPTGGVGWTQLA